MQITKMRETERLLTLLVYGFPSLSFEKGCHYHILNMDPSLFLMLVCLAAAKCYEGI